MRRIPNLTARDKMKTVMKVWTGTWPIAQAATFHKVNTQLIEKWCKIAMKGAKVALGEFYDD